uniref:(California timema) hypothetical protein n=1 Tax=Timema californicum TaxID=61474 RepID=A0A7R9P804_TIMCA|nr:unnamed protein product [Timema californicum]
MGMGPLVAVVLLLSIEETLGVPVWHPPPPLPASQGLPPPHALKFMRKYGYLEQGTIDSEALYTQEAFQDAIKVLQKFGSLPETGIMDNTTLKLMSSQRCGNPDVIRHKEGRQKRYIIGSEGWKKREITYFVANWSPKLGEEAVVDEIQRAFDSWSGYSRLTFRHVRDNTADIIIAFGRSDHRDGYPFDGPGGILAHAFYPYEMGSFGGDIHFDDDEEWKINPGELEDGVDFFTVAVHELGHSLGLSHSPVSSSIMFPYYKGFQRNFQLDYDDILAMYQLYSAKLRAMTQIEARDEVEHQNTILPLQISSRASSQPLAAKIEVRGIEIGGHGTSAPELESNRAEVARTLEGDNQTKSETSNPDDNNGDGSDDNDENNGSRVDENVPTTERPLPTAEPQLPTTTTTGISFNGDDESVEDHIEHGAGSTASPIPDICEGNYDTVANLREELFFFKGKLHMDAESTQHQPLHGFL